MAKLNPFRPGNPVPPGTFAGRYAELNQISRAIFQSSRGFPQNLLITGERGIGKTSVAHITKSIAEKNFTWDKSEIRLPVLTAYIAVQKNVPSAILLTEIVRELNQIFSVTTAFKNILSDLISKFNNVSIAGTSITLDGKEINPTEIYIEVERSLRNLCRKLSEKAKGDPTLFDEHNVEPTSICLIIDELDQMGDFNSFSSFWKTLQEKLAADGHMNLMLVFAGMPEIKDKLGSDHESFLRTFTPITLDKMPNEEAKRVIHNMLEKGEPKKTIAEDALNKILFYSENFPYLIQELGYSSFEVSEDNEITIQNVETGLLGNSEYPGSVKRLGELFFSQMYKEVIKSENYTDCLKLIAKLSGEEHNWVTRQNLLKEFTKKKTSLDVYLQELVKKNLIIRNPEVNGEYKLISKMFQVYVQKLYIQNLDTR